jgi:uncharacterized repeat protein (TIGR03803 family)
VKSNALMFLGLCLSASAFGQSVTLSQVFAFPCQSTTPWFCAGGAKPVALIQASDGNFYGTTETSYASHSNTVHITGGTIFKITPSGQFTLLHTFQPNPKTGYFDQGESANSLAEGSDGFLYGTAGGGPNAYSAGVLFKISKSGTGLKVIESYCTTCATGGFPDNIIAGTDGNLYGTTSAGGTFACQGLGCGVVFRLTTSGTYTVLHSLNGTTDSQTPLGVIQASDGKLYGTTASTYTGTIFQVDPYTGQFTTMYSFPAGVHSLNVATQASNGLLYGVSRLSNNTGPVTVYSSTLTGTVQNLVTLSFGSVKRLGIGPFLQASDGNLWSTSSAGGSSYFGTVFAVSTGGALAQDLSLDGTKGAYPVNGVIQTTGGTIYLTTTDRGTDSQGKEAFGTIATLTGLPPR